MGVLISMWTIMLNLYTPLRLQHTLLRRSLHHQELGAPLLAALMLQTVQALARKVGSFKLLVLGMYISFTIHLMQ